MSRALRSNVLLSRLQSGQVIPFREQLILTVYLSLPAMLAQISSIVMQYIDASMVGNLGSNESASIGLVSSSIWLFGGICIAATTGFIVQVAQRIGAGEPHVARGILKQALVVTLGFSMLLMLIGTVISGKLPEWLGGDTLIRQNASRYFLVYILSLPFAQMNYLAGGMLQCSGNMRVPSILNILMCGMDAVFNALLIFPSYSWKVFDVSIPIPGADFGVTGAALGTAFAEIVTAVLMLWFLLRRSPVMKLRKGEKFSFSTVHLKKAVQIAIPVGFEQIVMCGAQVVATRIVSPIGAVAIAANSFAVTAESFCYMPGYGIEAAATTLIGQSVGAGRPDLARRLGWISTGLGMVVMTCTGAFMYLAAPVMIGLLSPDPEIRQLGTKILRIEAFAEPMYAASIVASGVFRGAGDTLIPSCMNFISMWVVRLPLAAVLASYMGLQGVWIAMCTELCVRGGLFLLRLRSKRWLKVFEK